MKNINKKDTRRRCSYCTNCTSHYCVTCTIHPNTDKDIHFVCKEGTECWQQHIDGVSIPRAMKTKAILAQQVKEQKKLEKMQIRMQKDLKAKSKKCKILDVPLVSIWHIGVCVYICIYWCVYIFVYVCVCIFVYMWLN